METTTMRSLTLVLLIAGVSMGNESCEKSQGRVLKMEAEVGYFKAQNVRLPTGEVVDFPYVANALFYRQVMNNEHFTLSLSSAPVNSGNPASGKSVSGKATTIAGPRPRGATDFDMITLAKFGFSPTPASSASEPGKGLMGKTANDDAATPACLYDTPLVRLGGEVISFGSSWGIGLGIGYNGQGSTTTGLGVGGSVNFSQTDLELGMRWDDPLRGNPVAIADGISAQEKINLTVNFTPGVPLGFSFFFQEGIAKVIRDAMDSGLNELVSAYTLKAVGQQKQWHDAWESRIIYNPELVDNDTYVAFRGGSYGGLAVGDTFIASTMYYKWKGDACKSQLDYKMPTRDVAELEVVKAADAMTIARVTKYILNERLRPGDQVRVLKLHDPTADKKALAAAK